MRNLLFSAWLHSVCHPLERYRKPLAFFILLAAFAVLPLAAHAQEQGFRWGKMSVGEEIGNSIIDRVVDSYVDNVGNTYIFGTFGMLARLYDDGSLSPLICPMDLCALEMGYMIEESQGVFLAKIDSLGNILWCKSARNGSRNSGCVPWDNMVMKDNRITIAFDNTYGSEAWNWFYFFDTMLIEPSGQFHTSDVRTYFVTFDLNGNRLDYHSIQLFAYTDPEYTNFFNTPLSGQGQLNHRGYFLGDKDDNIHIFACGDFYGEDSLHKAYIIVDNDTNRRYPLNIRTLNGKFYSSTVYYKLNSSWNLVDSRFLIDSITVWSPSGSHYANINIEKAIIDGDVIYANCFFNSNDCYFSIDTLSVRVYLDSVHYLRIDNTIDWQGGMPCLLKLNKDGEIVWTQQLYNENESTLIPNVNYGDAGGVATDEENVYVYYLPDIGYDTKFYLDSLHNTRLPQSTLHAHSYCLVVSYNRNTGLPVDYYVVDTVNDCNMSHNSLAVLGDELLLDVFFGFNHYIKETALCKINKYTKEVTRSLSIRYGSVASSINMSVNSHGWVFRGEFGDNPRVYDSIFLFPGHYQAASVMTLFYDSSLDLHRPKPCSPVDSLWSDGTVGNTVTLSWSSSASHPGYELAYTPETGSWDNATIVETSVTTLAVTLPDDGCHLFRVRAMCDGNRVAHSAWSNSITVCPGVGIGEADGSSAITIYPNPFLQRVTIVVQNGEPLAETATLTDLTGRREQVHLKVEGTGRYTLDLTATQIFKQSGNQAILLTLTTASGKTNTVRLMKMSDIFSR